MSKVLLIGCGHMGSALIDAWTDLKRYTFFIVDPLNNKKLKKKYYNKNITILKNLPNQKLILNFDIIIFAVKPQVSEKVINDYKYFKFKKNSVIGSIIAGKKINFFKKNLKFSNQIIRIMPNMPSLIGKGVSCYISSKNVSITNEKKIEELFLKVGKIFKFKTEKEIDMATAVSGSGPGYVFTLINSLEKASNKIGFSKKISRELVLSTLLGSIDLMKKSKKEPSVLANSIAIKGGTTEAGIKILKKYKLNKIMHETILAAYKKATTLGKDD